MEINDNVFNKIEKKTNVSKENIINIASKLNEGNMKDPNTLSDIIHELANLTGKNVSKEKEDNIIELIVNDKVPKNIDNMI